MSASARFTRLPFLLRYALRDLGAGLRGFGIFLACIALGVAAITAVGSTSRALSEGLAREGRVILGGDASFAWRIVSCRRPNAPFSTGTARFRASR
jgi:putative ABC transport system permease protein